jgi:hypothetical protein
MLRHAVGALTLTFFLAGCVSPQQAQTEDDSACRQMGARLGSDVYVQCRLSQQLRRDARRREIADAFSDAGLALMAGQARTAPLNCTSTRFGSTIDTTCR